MANKDLTGAYGNYQADIHNASYEDQFLAKMLDSSSLININGRKVESLNGQWNFGVDWYDTCRRASWFKEDAADEHGSPKPVDYDWEAWERIKVPAVWNLERPELHYYESTGVYTRTFRYISADSEERVFLRFEGASYRTTVFLNGGLVGTHDGGSTPFNADISAMLKTDNRIIVVVDARRLHNRIPMENTDWFLYGGIYRDVYLVRTPKVFIKDVFPRLVGDGKFDKIQVDITVCDPVDGAARLDIEELHIHQDVEIKGGKGSVTLKHDAICLWSPENPKLYDVTVTFGKDSIRERTGFREIKTRGQEIFLNGKKIFLKGVAVHEDHFDLGKTTTPGIIRDTIRDLKELGGNYLRLAHYPHDARFAQIADEEGVLLWEEVPVYWAVDFGNSATYADAENQLSELILRDRGRAAVIIWSVGNENADTDDRLQFMSNLVKRARSLDDSRLVSAACLINHAELRIEDRLAEHLDILGINEYYGWYDPDFGKLPKILERSKPDKPVVICEFGADARSGQRGTVDDLWTEDKQRSLYEKQVATFKQCPYIAGTSPWVFYDFRCPRRLNRYQELFNRKGLIAEDRKTRKPAFFVMQEFYGER